MAAHDDEPEDQMRERVRAAQAGLTPLLAEAQATWTARSGELDDGTHRPGWRVFEDAFPTFYQFTNRPR
jgi:hypothetical protein